MSSTKRAARLSTILLLFLTKSLVESWVAVRPQVSCGRHLQHKNMSPCRQQPESFIDAEFEPLQKDVVADVEAATALSEKSLLDIALESVDEELKTTRIPFLDYHGKKNNDDGSSSPHYIDAKIAFMVDIDGVHYGIGVPFDAAAAVIVEEKGQPTTLLSPDEENYEDAEELMEIMAVQLQKLVGADLRLQRTPRCFTIAGPIDKYTKNWQDQVLKEDSAMKASDLASKSRVDDEDDGLAFFHDFMREELGDEEYFKTMNEDPDPDIFTPDLLDLFGTPEITTESLLDPEEDWTFARESLGLDKGLGLKLVSFLLNKKTYSLAQLMQPMSLVAKYSDGKFEMLSADEEKLIFPQLEEKFRGELQTAGLNLRP